MFNRKYVNAIVLDNAKDATLIAGVEGYGNVNPGFNDVFPVILILQKKRSYYSAIRKSLKYSKMGLFNCIMKAPPSDNTTPQVFVR